MENTIEPKDINGWGIDANSENDPTYPIKKRTDEEHRGYSWERPPQQPVNMEVLHSIERPNVTAVFGTAMPPRGLSGQIRRYAFKYSEGSFAHWLPLILADRVNVVEGIIEDIQKGHIPNIFAERGFNAEWKYNRKGFIRKVATTTLIASVTFALLSIKSRSKNT